VLAVRDLKTKVLSRNL